VAGDKAAKDAPKTWLEAAQRALGEKIQRAKEFQESRGKGKSSEGQKEEGKKEHVKGSGPLFFPKEFNEEGEGGLDADGDVEIGDEPPDEEPEGKDEVFVDAIEGGDEKEKDKVATLATQFATMAKDLGAPKRRPTACSRKLKGSLHRRQRRAKPMANLTQPGTAES
jgi:hypothetical protein